jgi:hypothetical protein
VLYGSIPEVEDLEDMRDYGLEEVVKLECKIDLETGELIEE